MRRVAFILLIVLTACGGQQTDFQSQEELDAYINDPNNGFIQKNESSDLIFEARLTPPMEGEKSKECTVQLRIKRKDGGSVLEYGGVDQQEVLAREGHLSFDLLKNVELKSDGKSFSPVFHHYERNYGLKPSIDVYFNFANIKVNSDMSFRYRDELFGQGLIEIEFNKDLFNKCYVAKT